jgi:hypothetical protein
MPQFGFLMCGGRRSFCAANKSRRMGRAGMTTLQLLVQQLTHHFFHRLRRFAEGDALVGHAPIGLLDVVR